MNKSVKRGVGLLMAIALTGGLFACGAEETEVVPTAMVLAQQEELEGDHFLGSVWKGVQAYGEAVGSECAFYQSELRQEDSQKKEVARAIEAGAEVVVLPGYLLEATALIVQDEYPDTHFILVDGVPNNADPENYVEKVGDNTHALMYAEEQAGYLAGYAAVMDGFTKLGFFGGMSVPTVTRFGYGYLQGAENAAQSLGLGAASIEVKYLYSGSFAPSPAFQAKAAQWYWDGTEVIFACGGAMGVSVLAAAEADEAYWVIGVDNDQSGDSPRVLTSAMKMVEASVFDALTAHHEGRFPGGESVHLGADQDGVGLPMETSRFCSFTKKQYDEIYIALATDEDGITSGILKDTTAIEDLPLSCVDLRVETMVES